MHRAFQLAPLNFIDQRCRPRADEARNRGWTASIPQLEAGRHRWQALDALHQHDTAQLQRVPYPAANGGITDFVS
jgi:hypothetical protein